MGYVYINKFLKSNECYTYDLPSLKTFLEDGKGKDYFNFFIVCEAVDHSINNNLDRILVSEQVDNFHCMLCDPYCHKLFPIVSSMHHERVGKPLHNWTLCFPETLD